VNAPRFHVQIYALENGIAGDVDAQVVDTKPFGLAAIAIHHVMLRRTLGESQGKPGLSSDFVVASPVRTCKPTAFSRRPGDASSKSCAAVNRRLPSTL